MVDVVTAYVELRRRASRIAEIRAALVTGFAKAPRDVFVRKSEVHVHVATILDAPISPGFRREVDAVVEKDWMPLQVERANVPCWRGVKRVG